MSQRLMRRIAAVLLGVAVAFGVVGGASVAHQSPALVADENPGGGNGAGGGG